jgi:capsule biosynthesis phosphatase
MTVVNTIYVDLDGTLCPVKREGERYEDLTVYTEVAERLAQARQEGLRVVVFTARNMRTFGGDISKINVETAPRILEWLRRHDVPFDGLVVGKPWPGPRGFYVDDRTVRPDEFVQMPTDKILDLLGPQER